MFNYCFRYRPGGIGTKVAPREDSVCKNNNILCQYNRVSGI